MSIEATRWAWTIKCASPAQKLILLSLADRADENNSCYPSMVRLSEDTGLDRKTVIKAISGLKESGIIYIKRRNGNVNFYQLSTRRTERENSTKNGTSPKNGTGPKNGTAPVPFLGPDQYQKRDTNLPRTYQEPTNIDLAPTVHSRLAAPKRPSVPVSQIVDLYHATLPMCPPVRKLTESRRRQIEARWRGGDLPDLDTWKDYFEFCAESRFLTGQAPPAPGQKAFVADLEWLTKEANYTKVFEKKYHR